MTQQTRTGRYLLAKKEVKKSQIEAWRDEHCYANVSSLGFEWQADPRSQDLLNKAISLAGLGLPLPPVWRTADNIDMNVTGIEQLLAVAGAIAYQTQEAYTISWDLKQQLAAASSQAEIDNIFWP